MSKMITGRWYWSKLDDGSDCIIVKQSFFGWLFGKPVIIFGDDIEKKDELERLI